MRIVGVIDLKDGVAVHARGGRRDLYAPVHQSAGVVVDGDPVALARLYVGMFGLSAIYVADLDAISAQALQAETIHSIGQLGVSVWVDAGVAEPADIRPVLDAGAQTLIVGLETLASFQTLADICAHSARPVAFSLDLRRGTPMNAALATQSPEAIAQRAVEAGAQTIIVLDVARVGGSGGPDVDLLRRIRSTVPEAELFAGGGVRGLDDLRLAGDVGCAGALIATALHEGRLTPADLEAARRF